MKIVLCQLNILLPSYCKNVLFKSFPIIVIGKQLGRHSSYKIERLLRGHLSGIFTCPLKLLKIFWIKRTLKWHILVGIWLPSALQKMICYFDNCICHQNCKCDVVLREDARLVPCGSHLWAMQPMWSTATIEICPYTKILTTVLTYWSL